MNAGYVAIGVTAALVGYSASYILVHKARARQIRRRIMEQDNP